MKIEKMTIADYENVYNLWINTPGMGLNTLDDSKAGIDKYLRRNPTSCFIAKENGEIIGVILSGHDGRRGYIYHTAVKQEKRYNGIGRALIDRSINALREEGINKIALVVFRKNDDGNNFWDRLGFNERRDLVYRNKVISIEELERINT